MTVSGLYQQYGPMPVQLKTFDLTVHAHLTGLVSKADKYAPQMPDPLPPELPPPPSPLPPKPPLFPLFLMPPPPPALPAFCWSFTAVLVSTNANFYKPWEFQAAMYGTIGSYRLCCAYDSIPLQENGVKIAWISVSENKNEKARAPL